MKIVYNRRKQLHKCSPRHVPLIVLDAESEKGHWGWSWLECWMAVKKIKTIEVDTSSSYCIQRSHHHSQTLSLCDPDQHYSCRASPTRRSHHSPALNRI